MRIHNFRAGFATNSSSSHSVVLLPPNMIGKVRGMKEDQENSFGWDHFRLVSEEAKLRYLAAQFFVNYAKDADALCDLVAKIDQEIPGYADEIACLGDKRDEWGWVNGQPEIDHQSVLGLPSQYDAGLVSEMIQFFRSPRVVVLGGNDNESDHSNEVPSALPIEFLNKLGHGRGNYVSRRDGEFWTLFSHYDGTKVRFSFNENDLSADAYVKSSVPELVDVKLTGWCDAGCKFCYMGSTKAGVHAPVERIEAIAKMLGEMGVFEVALGGGEPTAHPDFARILRVFHDQDIVPNFTTFSDKWLSNRDIVAAVHQTVGGIGVSVLDVKGLQLVKTIQDCLNNHRREYKQSRHVHVSAQHVIGSVPVMKTLDLLKAAFEDYIAVLLLGFKEVGFGATYERFDDESLETYIKLAVGSADNRWARLSVDTALVNRYPNLTKVLGCPEALVTAREGAFSCYIDATTQTCGASSYVTKDDMRPLPMDKEAFLNLFKAF